MRFSGKMEDARPQLVFQRIDRRKRFERLGRLVELGSYGVDVRAADPGNGILEQRAQWRTTPVPQLPFSISQSVQQFDRDAASDPTGKRAGFVAASENERTHNRHWIVEHR